MAFWDELRDKFTQGSQGALQKTRELADVMTMNAEISDSKRKIRELYEELGELLVKEAFDGMTSEQIRAALEEENGDDASRRIVLGNWKEFYSRVRYVRSEEEVIALNESKISELRSDVKCPNCGSRIMKGMSFCPECGAKVIKAAAGQEDAGTPVKEQAAPSAEEPQSEEKTAGQEQTPEA